MSVHVDELTSEVSVESEPQAPQSTGQESDCACEARMREMHRRMMEDRWRTAAERFDD